MRLTSPFSTQLNLGGSTTDNIKSVYSFKDTFLYSSPATLAGVSISALNNLSAGLTFFAKAMREHHKQKMLNFIDGFFGPSGPGYNYGGLTSDSYENLNLNTLGSQTSNMELTTFRAIYRSLTDGITSSAEHFRTLFNSRNTYVPNGSQSTIPIQII